MTGSAAEEEPEGPAWVVGPNDSDAVIERYGPGENEVILWDTTSNYARIRALRLEGKTVPEIAATLGLKLATVRQSLTNQLKMESAKLDSDEITSILQMEMDRLDHMLNAHWHAAKAGDIDSTKAVLAVGKERREWLKWAQPEPTAELGITNNILVVGGTEAEFLAQLDAARARLESEQSVNLALEGAEEVDGDPNDDR